MNLTLRGLLRWCAAFIFMMSPAFAQDAAPVFGLGERNSAAHVEGAAFRNYPLFRPAAGTAHRDVVAEETLLELDQRVFQQLLSERPEAMSIRLKTESGTELRIELMRATPIPANADLGIIDAGGRHRNGVDEGLHYQGIVTGEKRSMASLSVFPNGDVMGLFGTAEGNFNLGKLEDGSNRFILYNDKDLKIRPHAACQTNDNVKLDEQRANGSTKTARYMLCRRVRVYWEISYNVYTSKGSSLTNTRNYVAALFNQVSSMYLNENLQMELSSMYIWTTPDDYPQANSTVALNKFVQYWNFLGNSFNADLAHLITRDNNGNGGGNGGLAYVGVLCTPSFAYAYSDIYGTVATVPTFSWDVEVVTHETGHNLGSRHTHWCGWNTGTGSTCGAIDDCYTIEAAACGTTCLSTFKNSDPVTSWRGSVMSYCHLVQRGISLANGFGPLPGNAIRAEVAVSSCLNPTLRASLQTSPICRGAGSVGVVFDPMNGGTPPYTYFWTNGASTQTQTNLSTPGTYGLTINDSNGCKLTLSTRLAAQPFGGNGVPVSPAIQMPVCCGSPAAKLELRSSLTTGIGSCQTVYWLRSEAPITSTAEAQQHFDTATVTILPSKSVSSSGALVNVDPPANCTTPVSWYFTPVAVNKPHAADSITVRTTSVSPLSNATGTRLGSYTILPDQSSLALICDPADTPTLSELTITVSNYTGRAGKMSILIEDPVLNTVMFQRSGYAGAGTFVLTADSINGSMLGDMNISVYDYNCNGTVCIASDASMTVSRKVRYGARKAGMDAACEVGTSIPVSFAQNFCTSLSVTNLNVVESWNASLAPNPANGAVNLRYTAGAAPLKLDVTDVVGKRITGLDLSAGHGAQAKQINVQGWAKGVYFFNLFDTQGHSQRMKLVVE
jgi:hypothetical protein